MELVTQSPVKNVSSSLALYPPVMFLHGRVAGYFSACLQAFTSVVPSKVILVANPVDKLRPFKMEGNQKITEYSKFDLSENELWSLVEKHMPAAIVVSGWKDKKYLRIASKAKKKYGIPIICSMDNQWKGTFRQYMATAVAPFYLTSLFDYMWVPGMFQYEFVRRMGFRREQVKLGYYCADLTRFSPSKSVLTDQVDIPHRFLYVGRFLPIKGTDLFGKAIGNLCRSMDHDWKFDFVGKGPLREAIPELPAVNVYDFMQPEELAEFAAQGGVFVLPSISDQWGVVIHEFTALGYPMIVSDMVGAIAAFIREGYNGFIFPTQKVEELENALKKMIQLSPSTRLQMSERSKALSTAINHDMWVHALLTMMKLPTHGISFST